MSNTTDLPTNTAQIIDALSELAHDNGADMITPKHVAYMFGCSKRHAGRMIQVWQGAGSPVGIDFCPVCREPAHATESDDLGRHEECQPERVSIPLPWECATCSSKHPSQTDAAQCSHDRSRVDGGVHA